MKEKGSRRCKSKVNESWKSKKRGKKPYGPTGCYSASRSIGIIKGKSKVNESWKSKKRGKKPYGPTW